MMGGRPTISQDTPDPVQPVNPFAENEQYQALMEYQKSMRRTRINALMQSLMEAMQPIKNNGIAWESYAPRLRTLVVLKITELTRWNSRCNVCVSPGWAWALAVNDQWAWVCLAGFRKSHRDNRRVLWVDLVSSLCQFRVVDTISINRCHSHNINHIKTLISNKDRNRKQYGGYGMGQQMGGYGNYGGMQNPYQPQQYGNPNNFMGYQQPQQQSIINQQ